MSKTTLNVSKPESGNGVPESDLVQRFNAVQEAVFNNPAYPSTGKELMDKYDEILYRLGRIEGQMNGIARLSERVNQLEVWQGWLKGAWAALVAGYLAICRDLFGKH